MDQQTWTDVDDYFISLLGADDPDLAAAQRESVAAGLPPISVTANQGKFLNLLAKMQGARTILEVGTLGGYSTIWLARALPEGGSLVSLELESVNAEVARQNIARAGLGAIVEIRIGPALDSLSSMVEAGEGPFDFIFIDADKRNNVGYFTHALALSRPGTAIIVDNVVRAGQVLDGETDDATIQGVRRVADLIGKEHRVSATAIQTVSAKGYDGFILAIVR